MSRLFASGGKALQLQLQHQSSNEYLGLISFRTDWFDIQPNEKVKSAAYVPGFCLFQFRSILCFFFFNFKNLLLQHLFKHIYLSVCLFIWLHSLSCTIKDLLLQHAGF